MYVVIEMADVELVSVRLFENESAARACYEACCQENHPALDALPGDIERECAGTLAMCGDDAYSVQLLSLPVL